MKSISATERVKLWEQFKKPVDQETIKAEFFRKVHSKYPPFRYKLKAKHRICAEIPPMVEHLYKHPPPLLPSLRDVLRYEKVFKRTTSSDITNEMLCSQVEKEIMHFKRAKKNVEDIEKELITPKIEDEADDVQLIEEKAQEIIVKDIDDPMDGDEIKEEEMNEMPEITAEVKSETEDETPKTNGNTETEAENEKTDASLENKHLDNEKVEVDTQNDDKTACDDGISNSNQPNKRKRMTSAKGFGVECFELLDLPLDAFDNDECTKVNGIINDESIDDELKSLDPSVIKRLAFQQLQQILGDNPDLVTRLQTQRANKEIFDELKIKPKKIVLPSQLLTKEDIAQIAQQFASSDSSDTSFDEKADTKPRQNGKPLTIVRPSNDVVYTNGLDHIEDDTEKALAIARRLEAPILLSKVRARAVLTPVGDILTGKRFGFCFWYLKPTR